MSIRRTLAAVVLAPLLLGVAFLASFAWLAEKQSAASAALGQASDIEFAYGALRSAVRGARRDMRGYVMTRDARFREAYRRTAVEARLALAQFDALVPSNGGPYRSSDGSSLHAQTEDALQRDAETVSAIDRGRLAAARSAFAADRATVRFQLAGARFFTTVDDARAARASELSMLAQRTSQLLLGALLGALIISLASLAIIAHLCGRLAKLGADALTTLGGEAPRSAHSGDEIDRLASSFYAILDMMRDRQRSLTRDKLLWDRAPDMMLWLDADQHIIEANAAAGAGFDSPPADLLGKDVMQFCAPDSIADFSAAMNVARTNGHAAVKTTQVFKDGVMFSAEAAISSIGLDEELTILVVLRDQTEREAAEKALALAYDNAVEASRLKSQFVATMSHEIRTPMNAVIGMNELLMDTELTHEQREYTEGVRDSSVVLLSIIDDILDFSKIEAGGMELELIEMKPAETVESAVALLAPAAERKGISLMTYVDPQVPGIVVGDQLRLRQVLVNLIGNGVKFTAAGSVVVSVACRSRNAGSAQLRFSVKDSGIGLEPADAETIFEPFRQADGSTTRKFGGTGLGLSISRRLVELMGGKLTVESTPGAGAEFAFAIDFAHSARDVAEPAASVSGARVMIVDDDPSAREILYRYMVDWKIAASVTSSGTEALAQMRAQVAAQAPYRIALVDYTLPDLSPHEFAERIRADPTLRGIHLILVTAYDGAKRGEAAVAAGYSGYVAKPVRQALLFDAIAGAIHGQDSAALVRARLSGEKRPLASGNLPERHERILLVEDQLANQKLVVRQLSKLGFAALAASNGQEAVEACAHAEYDLILMDCQMPLMDGFAATRAIRKAEAHTGRHIPIVAMTANARREDRDECLAAGMDDYLAKPVMLEQIRAKVAVWLPGEAAVA